MEAFPFSLEHGLYLGISKKQGWPLGQTGWLLNSRQVFSVSKSVPWTGSSRIGSTTGEA